MNGGHRLVAMGCKRKKRSKRKQNRDAMCISTKNDGALFFSYNGSKNLQRRFIRTFGIYQMMPKRANINANVMTKEVC